MLLNMTTTVELEKIVPSKISAWHQILFIEQMSIARQTKIIGFIFGVAQTLFKGRFWNHNRVLNHKQYIKNTELSKYIWLLKDAGTPYTINWSIVAKVKVIQKLITVHCVLLKNITLQNILMTFIYLIKRMNLLMHVDIKVNCYLRI